MSNVEIELLHFTWQDEFIMLARLLVAGLAGAIVGFERRYSGKRAGVRTVTLVSMGAAVFTIVSLYGFEGADTARVAAQVASGVGFLGAGTILHHRGNVRGLTTAAAIWVAAALGVAAGVGLFILAIMGALLATASVAFLPHRVPGQRGRDGDSTGEDDGGDELE